MFFSSAAKTLLAIEDMDVGNVGILLDFGRQALLSCEPR